jgi:GT2 family glycosyltransferase
VKDLSIIIVSYNVAYFLEQTLRSVHQALAGLEVEIIVIDNASSDNSVAMIQQVFPQVKLIANAENVGFSKANNQGIAIAKGKYILLLNPDTVIGENTLRCCFDFAEQHPELGGLGVKMIDGSGHFLPESKRGLPTPWVSFYKLFGLSALFPTSQKMGKYYMSYLPENKTHEVEILSGAFMWLRAETLQQIGYLDETFFMYGEDIDLSYRILKYGYKNYYLADTTIIHYKGESTKRTSVNYVFVFYQAMLIFARKHFSKSYASWFSVLVQLAVYFRAFIALLERLFQRISLPLLDAILIWGGMFFLTDYWQNNHKAVLETKYPPQFMTWVVPFYIVIWLLSAYLYGAYQKPYKIFGILKGITLGTIVVAALTNFIEAIRFSKALIILGGVWSIFAMTTWRVLLHIKQYKNLDLEEKPQKRILIVGSETESERVTFLLQKTNPLAEIIGFLTTKNQTTYKSIGSYEQLEQTIAIYEIDEVIFCSKDLDYQQIIATIEQLKNHKISFRIVPKESDFIIGSSSSKSQGDYYHAEAAWEIATPAKQLDKRNFDVIAAFAVLLFSPILLFLFQNKIQLLRNSWQVLIGKKTWIGFAVLSKKWLKKGILHTAIGLPEPYKENKNTLQKLDELYAKNYQITTDLKLWWKNRKFWDIQDLSCF